MPSFKVDNQYPVIVITVYHRIAHLKGCIESLERAEGAENHHVIVGSDAPLKVEHAAEIESVRSYLKEKQKNNGFKRLSVIYNDSNVGQIENIRLCNELAESLGHESFIMMEDDIIVGKWFLKFISNGLALYSDDERVIGINGYISPDIANETGMPFLHNRFCAYGFASWYKKWDLVLKKINSKSYARQVLSDFNLFRKIVSFSPNAKSYPFLAESHYRAWDIEIGLMMELEGCWVLVPPVSLTANRGMDGSGLRSGIDPLLQSLAAHDGKVVIPEKSTIEKIKLQKIKNKIGLKNLTHNWIAFLIYNYIPGGFSILRSMRKIKKSMQF